MLACALVGLVAAASALLLTPGVRALALAVGAADEPGGRHIHRRVVPRLGGIAVVAAFSGALAFAAAFDRVILDLPVPRIGSWVWPLIGALVVAAIGVVDDVRRVGPPAKLTFQLLAGTLVFVGGYGIAAITNPFTQGTIYLGWLSLPVTLLWVVGITNAFNLIDGLDGLAAGVAFIATITLLIVSLLGAHPDVAIIAAALSGSLAGFLVYNFNPASIFLGDSGSLFLGYVLSVLSIRSAQKGSTAVLILVPVLALGLPIADVLLTTLRRFLGSLLIVRGENAWERYSFRIAGNPGLFCPDQKHIHHRLVNMGLTHRVTVFVLYGVCLALGILAFLAVRARGPGNAVIVGVVAVATYLGMRRLGYPELKVLQRGTLLPLFDLPVFNRRALHALMDTGSLAVSYGAAFVAAHGATSDLSIRYYVINTVVIVVAAKLTVFLYCGLYQRTYRYTNAGDLLALLKALLVAQAVTVAILGAAYGFPPRGFAVLLLDFYLSATFVVGPRVTFKLLDILANSSAQGAARRVLIYGAGRGGTAFLRETQQNPQLGYHAIGFVDDRPELWNQEVNGVPVVGAGENLGALIPQYQIHEVVLSTAKIPLGRIRMAADLCAACGVPLRQFRIAVDPLPLEMEEHAKRKVAYG